MINNPRWVKWKHFNQDGYVGKDYMLKSDVSAKIKEFEKIAANLLIETEADHVLYAIKYFDEYSNLDEVKFYELPMSDDEFEYHVARQVRVQVFALHRKEKRVTPYRIQCERVIKNEFHI